MTGQQTTPMTGQINLEVGDDGKLGGQIRLDAAQSKRTTKADEIGRIRALLRKAVSSVELCAEWELAREIEEALTDGK